jgi:hypothetical protein
MPGVAPWSDQDVTAVIVASPATNKAELDVEESAMDGCETTQPKSPNDDESVDPGAAFTAWLAEGLRSGALALNTPKAQVHVVKEGLFLDSPAVFRAFAGDNWREVQKRFLKQKLIEKTAAGKNFFHYVIDAESGSKTIKGVLIRNAEAKLSVTLPAANRLLSRKTATRK